MERKAYMNNLPPFKNQKRRDFWFVFTIPALVIYIWFMAFPLFNSMRLSLYNGSGFVPTHFVAMKNYVDLFTNPIFRDRLIGAFLHTCLLFVICMGVQNTLGLMFANILSGSLKGRSIYRTIIFLPVTLSVLVTGFLWRLILNPNWGAVNQVLGMLGLTHFSSYPWLGDPKIAMVVVGLVTAWQWVGLPTMIFLAGFQGIPDELFEAANIDGASRRQTFWKVKIPLLLPVVSLVSILTFVGNFNAFDIVFGLENANGAPDYATDIMGTFFYRIGIAGQHPIGEPNMGVGASIATVIFFILLTGVTFWMISQNKLHSKKD